MMSTENRQCQNCKNQFTIETEDFVFYKKMKVPTPTFCPECRLIRRMVIKNERSLYKRKCDAPGHEEIMISMYPPDSKVVVYDSKYWWSDDWNPFEYGQDYDFNTPFFEQFQKLLQKVPFANLININPVETEYANYTRNLKNCYLMFSSGGIQGVEDSLYGYRNDDNKNAVDTTFTERLDRCYQILDGSRCTRVAFAQQVEDCMNSWFLYDCKNCSYCFGCIGLRNRQYCILNKQYAKEDYHNELGKLGLENYQNFLNFQNKFEELKLQSIHKYAYTSKSTNVSGDVIFESKNVHNSYVCWRDEDAKNLINSKNVRDSHDVTLGLRAELLYEVVNTLNSSNVKFGFLEVGDHNTEYLYNCFDCKDCFGCISLRKKQYCILNKQYGKDEYEALLPRIRAHMDDMPYIDKLGRVYKYGEFFPSELSPFAYNKSVAQEYFPLTKTEAKERGYTWRDPETRNYDITKKSKNLPSHIGEINTSILEDVIGCEHEGLCLEECTVAFKITTQELQFYRDMKLPLPRLCPNCRHYQRLKKRNPMRLYHRQCMCDYKVYKNSTKHQHHPEGKCPNEFETSFDPNRPEIVYCEQCYNAEIA